MRIKTLLLFRNQIEIKTTEICLDIKLKFENEKS